MNVHFSSKSMEWSTPQNLFDELNREFGFIIDVCASPKNQKCPVAFYSGALEIPWIGPAWMNPPYGREIAKWLSKADMEAKRGVTVVCLIPARTDTSWWHEIVMKYEIRFLRGRLSFTNENGKRGCAPFPSAIIVMKK